MAITTEAANRVRQKTLAFSRNPGVFYELKALFLHLAANKGNPDLQYVNVDGTSMSSDGGAADQVVANAACSLYAIYLKKFGTTASWFKLADSATATAGDGTDVGPNLKMLNGSANTNGYQTEEFLLTFPSGRQQANGITIAEDTTATGTTDTLKANRADGFIILAAATV